MMLYLLFICYGLAAGLEKVDFTLNDKEYVIIDVQHNNIPQYISNVYAYRSKSSGNSITIVVDGEKESKKYQYQTSELKRLQIGFAKNNMYVLNNGNVDVFDLNSTISGVISHSYPLSNIDSYSPMTVITKEFVSYKPEVFIVLCQNNGLTVFNESFNVVDSTKHPCGNFSSYGYSYLMVRGGGDVELYTLNQGGKLSFYTNFEIKDNSSITFNYDMSIINEYDVVYSVISDKNKIQVNSPNNYAYPTFIDNVFINPKQFVNPINTQYVPMMSTYNSFLVIGGFGYSVGSIQRGGAVSVYFDNYLVSTKDRFKLIYSLVSNSSYDYMGYSVAMDSKTLYYGGKTNILLNGSATTVKVDVSKITAQYCTGTLCYCAPGYYYNSYMKTCLKQIGGVSSIIIAVICIFILILIIALISVLYKKWSRKHAKSFTIDGQSYPFTPLEELPFTFSTEVLTFGYEDGNKAPINRTLEQSLTITNNSTVNKQFDISLPTSYKFNIQTNVNNMSINAGEQGTVRFTITFLCTCSCNDDDIIAFAITEEGNEEPKFVYVTINVSTEESVFIDYKDVLISKKIDNGPNSETLLINYKDKSYAMKKFTTEFNEELMNVFRNKINSLIKLENEYLLPISFACIAPQNNCLINEYSIIGNLKNIYSMKESPKQLIWRCLLNAAQGIQYLHQRDIIHRDIKPENIIIFSTDYSMKICAKLTDYDLPNELIGSKQAAQLNQQIGQEIYFAPEGINNKEITSAYDIYSLAIVIVEAFDRKCPYSMLGSSWEVLEFVNKGKRVEISNNIPPTTASIIPKMWDQSPEKRCKINEVIDTLMNSEKELEESQQTVIDMSNDIVGSLLGDENTTPSQPIPTTSVSLTNEPEKVPSPTPIETSEANAADDLAASLLDSL
ncbi:hypothetical protein ENUP19_0102G0014 [Entamoeba nuttalli]|uniref:Protein kinase, putative n=2 Tax=Entamoeba nuttalli TaxID=412467 RepID=K2GVC7_ENTNP|nr:protein kinase, putative [Entamoeba nuttalli P19]EKE37782.1 protein kinase, putative [Entamoeba nuttalli P19]|eukprot:XP_008859883.1 protein kinase, putative [Entamoeba nuttalli P19]